MTNDARYLIAAGLLILALLSLIPNREKQVALPAKIAASSVPDKTRHAAEYETPERTTIPRASRHAVSPPRTAPPVPKARSGPTPQASGDLLDRLAMCESGMDPRRNTGNGFYGAFQWMLSTWHGMGMSGNPIDYSYAEQKAVAARIPVSSWHRQFPTCSRRLGV
jgi:resuscitation-promoting factor RpfB